MNPTFSELHLLTNRQAKIWQSLRQELYACRSFT